MTQDRRKRTQKIAEEVAQEAGAAPAAPAAGEGLDLDHVLDALASVLRVWGRMAIDLPDASAAESSERFEAWARHALLGTPPPGLDQASDRRDWIGLDRYIRKHRGDEREYITGSLADLRHIVWIFVESFSKALSSDRATDARIVKQLETLRDAAGSGDTAELRQQALAATTIVEGVIEVRAARYVDQIERLSSRLDQVASQLIESREKGSVDALTGAHNRAAIDEHLLRITHLGSVLGSCSIVFMIDIDHFKWVNDRFGHQVGDDVLRRGVRNLRRSLARRDDFVGRYGGDEFIVTVHGRSREEALQVGERILFAIREIEAQAGDEKVRVSASVGAALLRQGEVPKSWIERADQAMYESKRAGRDRVTVAEE